MILFVGRAPFKHPALCSRTRITHSHLSLVPLSTRPHRLHSLATSPSLLRCSKQWCPSPWCHPCAGPHDRLCIPETHPQVGGYFLLRGETIRKYPSFHCPSPVFSCFSFFFWFCIAFASSTFACGEFMLCFQQETILGPSRSRSLLFFSVFWSSFHFHFISPFIQFQF